MKLIFTVLAILITGMLLCLIFALIEKAPYCPDCKSCKCKKVLVDKSKGIPKIIHQIWVGSDMPVHRRRFSDLIKAWCDKNGWGYRLWGNEDLNETNFPHTFSYIQDLRKKKKIIWSSIGDLMSFEILYRHGGVYMDLDLEIKSTEKFISEMKKANLSSKEFLGCNEEENRLDILSHSFMASVKGGEAAQRLCDPCNLCEIDFSLGANVSTGPFYIQHCVAELRDSPKTSIWPTSWIYPLPYKKKHKNKCLTKNSEKALCFDKKGKLMCLNLPCSHYQNDCIIFKHWIGQTWF